jgi:hypothetical protein
MRKTIAIAFVLVLGACASSPLGIGDGGGQDLAVDDAAVGDASGPPRDFGGADLAGLSDVGYPCGGFTMNPRRCLPGLICKPASLPDAPGTCAPPGSLCVVNGEACSTGGECCSNNCITRTSPGYCCQPGGCP